jgi:hypothetical protein
MLQTQAASSSKSQEDAAAIKTAEEALVAIDLVHKRLQILSSQAKQVNASRSALTKILQEREQKHKSLSEAAQVSHHDQRQVATVLQESKTDTAGRMHVSERMQPMHLQFTSSPAVIQQMSSRSGHHPQLSHSQQQATTSHHFASESHNPYTHGRHTAAATFSTPSGQTQYWQQSPQHGESMQMSPQRRNPKRPAELPQLDPYASGFDLDNYLQKFEAIETSNSIPRFEWARHLLGAIADKSLQAECMELFADDLIVVSWEAMKLWLKKHIVAEDKRSQHWAAFTSLSFSKSGKTASQFNVEFKQLMSKVNIGKTEEAAILTYLKALEDTPFLHGNLIGHLASGNPRTLDCMMEYVLSIAYTAEQQRLLLTGGGRTSTSWAYCELHASKHAGAPCRNGPAYVRTPTRLYTPAPANTRFGSPAQAQGNTPPPKSPTAYTTTRQHGQQSQTSATAHGQGAGTQQTARRPYVGTCFHCKQSGHKVSDCPSRSTMSAAELQFEDMELNEVDMQASERFAFLSDGSAIDLSLIPAAAMVYPATPPSKEENRHESYQAEFKGDTHQL